MENKFEFDKKLAIVLGIVVLLLIILKVVSTTIDNKYEDKKVNKDKAYVYTKYNSTFNNSYVPYINIKGAEKINEELYENSKAYLTSNDKNKSVTYRYNQNKNILSLVMTYRDNVNDELTYTFKTYVFDLNNTPKLLSDDEILKLYGVTKEDVSKEIAKQLKQKYDKEVNKGYFNKTECNFSCYLGLRDIVNPVDEAKYYIENSHLVVYRTFNAYSIYNEERFFTRNDFKFIIK